MKIDLNYEDSSSESSIDSDNSGSSSGKKVVTTLLTTSPLPVTSDEDDSDESTVSDVSLLGNTNPVTALKEQEDWQFDIGIMENQRKKMEDQTNKVSATEMAETNDFDVPKVSTMSEELSVISMELEETNNMIQDLVQGKENEIKEFRRSAVRRNEAVASSPPTTFTNEYLDQRKKERAARLARARQRIAKDKERLLEQQKEEERKRKEEEAKACELDTSEAARRDRVYMWYSRCGQPKKEEFKRRIANVKHQGITPADVDLLPWNFNGTAVNVARMMKYQNMGATRD